MSTLANSIKTKLEQNIVDWRLAGVSKLPSERALSERHNTTRVTIREALRLLETEGLIFRENRRGWFIAPPRLTYDPSAHGRISFVDYASQQGFKPSTRVLSITRSTTDKYLAAAMQTTIGKPVYRINRLRSLDARPVLFERIILRADLLPDLEQHDLETSLHALLRKAYAMTPEKAAFEISVSSLPDDVAEHLSAPSGLSSLKFKRKYCNQHGIIFEYDQEYWRHDAISVNFGFSNS